MIQGYKKQAGMTMWQWMVILSVAGFLLTLAVKLGPVYLHNVSVQSIIKDLANDKELGDKSEYDIRNSIEKRFDVNQISVIQAVCHNKDLPCLSIDKTKDTLTIDANYEARVHVMANVDAVVVFEHNVAEIPISGG